MDSYMLCCPVSKSCVCCINTSCSSGKSYSKYHTILLNGTLPIFTTIYRFLDLAFL